MKNGKKKQLLTILHKYRIIYSEVCFDFVHAVEKELLFRNTFVRKEGLRRGEQKTGTKWNFGAKTYLS